MKDSDLHELKEVLCLLRCGLSLAKDGALSKYQHMVSVLEKADIRADKLLNKLLNEETV